MKLLIVCCLEIASVLSAQETNKTVIGPAQKAAQLRTVENPFATIRILPGWVLAPSTDQTLTLVRGKYVLSIDPIFEHASGISGGRFGEIVSGKQSIDAVMSEVGQPAGGFECAQMPFGETVVSETISLHNLYTDSSKTGNGCWFPSSGHSVWFGSFFSGGGSESDYAITLTYSSYRVDELPRKGSADLRLVFSDVITMLRTLELKPPMVISRVDPQSVAPGGRVTFHGKGFRFLNRDVEVQFREYPGTGMSDPIIAADGTSLTFGIPTSVGLISCPAGRIDVNEWCVPIPKNHVDVDDCPAKPDGSTNFCAKPLPPGTYHLWVSSGSVNTDVVPLTVIPPKDSPLSIRLLYPSALLDGDVVTIRGSGFTSTDNSVQIGSVVIRNLSSPDGNTVQFEAPGLSEISSFRGARFFDVVVMNAKGKSNSISVGYR